MIHLRQPFSSPVGELGRAAPSPLWSFWLALMLCAATAILLMAGALVTSTGSSLAVPDWPLSYGQLFPPMVGGILYEHGHRLIAATVGLITIVLAAWLWWAEPRRWVRWLGVGALGAVVLQGLLGGLTVLLLLPKFISIGHALLAQGFFLLTVLLAQVTAPGWHRWAGSAADAPDSRLPGWSMLTFAVLIGELFLGALVRHYGAGLAIPDFPLAFGRLVPPLTAFPIVIHFLHRVGALVVLVAIAGTLWQLARHHAGHPGLMRPGMAMGALAVLQVLLGGAIVWTLRAPVLTSLHLVNGALLIAAAGLLALRSHLALGRFGPGIAPRPVGVSQP